MTWTFIILTGLGYVLAGVCFWLHKRGQAKRGAQSLDERMPILENRWKRRP